MHTVYIKDLVKPTLNRMMTMMMMIFCTRYRQAKFLIVSSKYLYKYADNRLKPSFRNYNYKTPAVASLCTMLLYKYNINSITGRFNPDDSSRDDSSRTVQLRMIPL